MILTGKALEDFSDKCTLDFYQFKVLTQCMQNALIIEWFDSVGIYIILLRSHISNNMMNGKKGVIKFTYNIEDNEGNLFKREYNTFEFKNTRQEATEKAIIKANEIYNERTNISNQI